MRRHVHQWEETASGRMCGICDEWESDEFELTPEEHIIGDLLPYMAQDLAVDQAEVIIRKAIVPLQQQLTEAQALLERFSVAHIRRDAPGLLQVASEISTFLAKYPKE